MNILLTLSTWIHVLCAAFVVGGLFYLRVVVLKYANREGGLSDDLRKVFLNRYIHTSFGFLIVMLVTGLYNMTQKSDAWSAAEGISPHMIFGIKFILFLVFAIIMGLAAASKKNDQRRVMFLSINTVLGIIIFLMSAWLSTSY